MQPTTQSIPQAVELLLAATFNVRQDGRRENFLFGRPEAGVWARNMGTEIFHTKLGLLKAALHVRNCGPAYLRNLSIHELEEKLTHFLIENYWFLANETWARKFACSYAEQVSSDTKAKLTEVLAKSEIFTPRSVPTLFPLVPIRVAINFDSELFFLIQPSALDARRLGKPLQPQDLIPEQFPPISNWQGVRETPGAWLGIRAPTLYTARKLRSAILGAVALLPHPRKRHMFSGRKMFGGHITINEGWSIALGEGHTPPLYEDIVIDTDDHAWLSVLAVKLGNTETDARKHVKALEYYYRAWPLDEVERFPVLFMALDAIFGDASQATQAVVDAVGPVMGPDYDHGRLKLLLSMRASVIHGGAPDVYDTSKYFKYYERYIQDPIYDLELITSRCLQSVIFGGTLVSRQHACGDNESKVPSSN